MAVAFVQRQKQQGPSTLDNVLKGVQLASTIIGGYKDIKDIQKTNLAMDTATQEAEALSSLTSPEAAVVTKQGRELGLISPDQTISPKQAAVLKVPELYAEKAKAGFKPQTDSGLKQAELGKMIGEQGFKLAKAGDPNAIEFTLEGGKKIALVPGQSGGSKAQKERLELEKLGLEIAAKKTDVASAKQKFEALPVEAQKEIDVLAKSSANKTAINNQLKATLATLKDPSQSREQKLMAGQNLGKTLNSTEGADAVGSEESQRLLAFLNQLPIGRPGWDVGPQLDKFTDQVEIKTRDIDKAIESNRNAIKSLYGDSTPNQGQSINKNGPLITDVKKLSSTYKAPEALRQIKVTPEGTFAKNPQTNKWEEVVDEQQAQSVR